MFAYALVIHKYLQELS